jgi:hypothetical protein
MVAQTEPAGKTPPQPNAKDLGSHAVKIHAGGTARPRRKWAHESRHLAVSLCAPAVRLVVVGAWAYRERQGGWAAASAVRPVVALQAALTRAFAKPYAGPDPPSGAGTENDLLKAGWRLAGEESNTTALVVDPEYGLIGYDDPLVGDYENGERQLVPAPWPPAEDEERLAPVVAEMKQRALARAKGQEARRAVEAAPGPAEGERGA